MPDTLDQGQYGAGPERASWGPPSSPTLSEDAVAHAEPMRWKFRRVISLIGVIVLGAWGWGAMVDSAGRVIGGGSSRIGTRTLGLIGLMILIGWSVFTSMLFARCEDRRAWRLVGIAWLIFLPLAVVAWAMTNFNDGRETADDGEAVESLQDLALTQGEADDHVGDVVQELEAAGVDPIELALSDYNDGYMSGVELETARAILRYQAETIPGMETVDETAWSDADIRLITAEACAIAPQANSGLDFEQRMIQVWSADTADLYVHKAAIAGAGMNWVCGDEFDRLLEDQLQQVP